MVESKVGGVWVIGVNIQCMAHTFPLLTILFFARTVYMGSGQLVETFLSLPLCTVTRVFSPEADQWSPTTSGLRLPVVREGKECSHFPLEVP